MKSNRFIKLLDWYIIKKFLGTYVFAIALIISIAVVFDFNEKMDKFMEREAPWSAIVFDYYMNFIPYFANLFSPLFVFIAVIFFTSKLAENSEIIAMFSTGMSFKRLMRPYMISAAVIAVATFMLGSYVIPKASPPSGWVRKSGSGSTGWKSASTRRSSASRKRWRRWPVPSGAAAPGWGSRGGPSGRCSSWDPPVWGRRPLPKRWPAAGSAAPSRAAILFSNTS